MKRKYAKVAVALAAAVTITAPGAGVAGNSGTVMAAEQTEDFQEISNATEFQNAIATGSGSYKLTADMTVSNAKPPKNSNLTIDLNGHNLVIYWNLTASAGTSLRLMDSSQGQTGTMSAYKNKKPCLFNIGSDVQLTIESGNYICEEETEAASMFTSGSITDSNIVINGGTFSATDGTYVFRGKTNQTIEEALQNVTINGGTFGENALDIKNAKTEGPKAYLTADGEEKELSTEGSNAFKACTSLRLTDDLLVTSVKLNDSDLGQSGKEVTISPASLKTGNGEDGKNTLVVTDFEGNSVTYIFYIDNVAPAVTSTSVSPENSQVYYGAKTFTFETSEPIQSPGEGWTDASENTDGTKWAKEFTTNQKFTLTLTDLAGNTVTTDRYEVKNIETETLVPQVTYSTTDPTKEDVTVTVSTGAVECQTPEGWTRAESNKKNLFQKVYTGNTEETVTFVSLGGQQVPVEIKISNIDKEAPQLVGDISFTPDNSQMSLEKVVSFEANEAVVSPGEGWTEVEGSNGTKWQKVYQQAMKDSVTLTDLAGNTSEPINFEVKRIEDTELAAEVIYSNEGQAYTNQDVTVTIRTNVECQTPEGWTKTGDKRNQFEKTFSADAEETVTLVSLAGQNISQQISVKGIDKEAPKAYVNGTEAIDESIVYNDGVSLKFSDNAALDRYELNGQPGPTSIAGNKWGDGNLQNIKGSLVDGVNTLVVWDMAGNSSEYQFTVDLNIPQTVGVNYYIPAEDRYVEGQIVVDDDATTVDPTTLTDIPEGYEVISTDAAQINDGWIYVELQQIVTTKEVGVNYYIPAEDRYVEGKVVVDKDATTVDLAALTDIPEGYEVISTDAAQINDGWIYVELQQIVTTKEVGVNYYIPAEDRYVEGKVVVDKDATTVDPAALTDIPEGYEVISTDAAQINDEWIYVELQKTVNEAAATLQVNFVGEFGEDIGVAPVVVTKNGPEGETANFVYGEDWTLPEGYTFAADFDEAAATQTISVKYGETLNSLQIGIVPIQQEEPQEAVATLQVNFVGEFGEDIGVAPVVVTKNGTAGEWANFVYGQDWTLPEGYTFAADFDEAAATQTISVKYGETLNSLQIGILPIQQETVVESPEPAAETAVESAEPAAETVEESAEPAAETVEEIAEPTTEEAGNTEPVADGEETAAESAEPAAEVSDGAQSE